MTLTPGAAVARRLTWYQFARFGMAVAIWQTAVLSPTRTANGLEITPERAAELSSQFPYGVIPIWALTQDAPVVRADDLSAVNSSPDTMSCPPSLSFTVGREVLGIHFDTARSVTEIYNSITPEVIRRYDIDSQLNLSSTQIALDSGLVWLAHDLDLDGDVDLVSQWGDELKINSAPDWTQRAYFRWPGYNVIMNPTLVELDGDPYPEIFLTPNTLGLTGRIVVIDYDPVGDTFLKIVDYVASDGAYGQPAVGDFDEDGRMEVIVGSDPLGYHLYEWQESTLVDIGFVGDSIPGREQQCNSVSSVAGWKALCLARTLCIRWRFFVSTVGANYRQHISKHLLLPGFQQCVRYSPLSRCRHGL